MADTIKLTLKQEQFARNVAGGMSQIDAYRHAYDTNPNVSVDVLYVKAAEVAKIGKVAVRIAELRKECGDNAPLTSREHQLSVLLRLQAVSESHVQKIRKVKDDETGEWTEEATYNKGAGDIVVRTSEAINKMCGYNEPDKTDTAVTVEFVGMDKDLCR